MNPLFLFRKEMTPIRKLLMMKAVAGGIPISEYTATGNPLSFNTNVIKPLKSLLIPWTPVQSGTGDPSPTNVRPISGVSALNVWQTGKNLFDYDASKTTQETTSTGTTRAVYHTGLKNGTYTLSGALKTGETAIAYGVNYGKFANNVATVIGNFIAPNSQDATERTITVGADEEVIFINPSESISDLNNKLYKYNIQIELGSSASAYTPYTGQTYPVTFPALGKNLFNKDDEAVTTGVWWKGRVQTGGAYDSFKASNLIPVVPGETYRLTRTTTGQSACCYFDSSKTYVSQENWDNYNPSRTIPEGVYYFAFTVNADAIDSAMFEKGSTQSSYEPYTNTVYGGSLDLTTGVLTVEYIGVSALWGDIKTGSPHGTTGNMAGYIVVDNPILISGNGANASNSFCNVGIYKWDTAGYEPAHFYPGTTNNGTVYRFQVYLHSSTNDETVVQCVGELETHVIVTTLTPTQIDTLLGDNVIWTDTNGSNTAVYLKKG